MTPEVALQKREQMIRDGFCVKAGSLVMRDARLLHSVRKNYTDKRRTMLLLWIRRPNTIPDYWSDEIPKPILNRDKNEDYPGSQTPGEFLRR